MSIFDRPDPTTIFTPRGDYNPKMYAPRDELEKDFGEKLRRNEHIVIYGDSGCGKSWLYRNFFLTNDVYFKIVNLADASRNRSIASELLRVVQIPGTAAPTGYDEKKAAQIGIPGAASGSLEHIDKYTIVAEDPLRCAIKEVRKSAGKRQAFIVLDNLERIFDKPDLMDELADLITLADDPTFTVQKVRFLLVGVPAGVRDFFNQTPSHRTVSNRLIELMEVSRLTEAEARKIIQTGFKNQLDYKIEPGFENDLLNHVLWITDRIPQALHEFCLELAFMSEKDALVTKAALELADKKWLRGTLNSAYVVVEGQLNERDTKVQRRNQVLFVLGQILDNEFKVPRVESEIRKTFYGDDPSAQIGGVGNCLSELTETRPSEGVKPVLRKTAKGDAFMFLDPQYRMCIRAMLRISTSGKVEKIAIDQV